MPEEAYPLLMTGEWHKEDIDGSETLEKSIWSKCGSALTHWQQAGQVSGSSPETEFPCG